MTTLYKLTDQRGNTRGDIHWDVGITHSVIPCDDPRLCTNQVVHAYNNPNLGLLLNPGHAEINDPLLWEAEGEIVVQDWGKMGVFSLTITRKLDTPGWYADEKQRRRVQVAFAILCAEQVIGVYEKAYPNDERPRTAIKAAKAYLLNSTAHAAYAAAQAAQAAHAADAAYAAAHAAYAAAQAADAAYAAAHAAYAAYAAAHAAYAAAHAADAAYAAHTAYADEDIDFGKLADQAIELADKA